MKLPGSLRSASTITPSSDRTRTDLPTQTELDEIFRTPSRPARQAIFVTKPFNEKELEIVNLLDDTLKPFCPYLFSHRKDKARGQIIYCFEKLQPLLEDDGLLSKCFFSSKPIRFVIDYAKFFLDCCLNLELLHTEAEIIHSDISPNNIMYSSGDRMWKFIDYDQSASIEESLSIERTAGTPDFIAPEALEKKIFTIESDIWSLGMVLYEFLHSEAIGLYEEGPSWLDKAIDDLGECVFDMIDEDPLERPSLQVVIRRVYKILVKLDPAREAYPEDKVIKEAKVEIKACKRKAVIEKERQERIGSKRVAAEPLPPLSHSKMPLLSAWTQSVELTASDDEKDSGQSL